MGPTAECQEDTPGGPSATASHGYRFALLIPVVDVCMCGPKNNAQMKEAFLGLRFGPLNREKMERMGKICDID